MGFSVEISPVTAGEFFWASAVPRLEAAAEAQKKSPLVLQFLLLGSLPIFAHLCLLSFVSK
jgi:hypothetical protein